MFYCTSLIITHVILYYCTHSKQNNVQCTMNTVTSALDTCWLHTDHQCPTDATLGGLAFGVGMTTYSHKVTELSDDGSSVFTCKLDSRLWWQHWLPCRSSPRLVCTRRLWWHMRWSWGMAVSSQLPGLPCKMYTIHYTLCTINYYTPYTTQYTKHYTLYTERIVTTVTSTTVHFSDLYKSSTQLFIPVFTIGMVTTVIYKRQSKLS